MLSRLSQLNIRDERLTRISRPFTERWRALSDVEKAKYEDMAKEDKLRFQMEMQHYQATHGGHTSQEPYYETSMGYDAYADAAHHHHDPYAVHHHAPY